MFIELHGKETSLVAATEKDIAELIDILGIPRPKYTEYKDHISKTVTSLNYGFGKSGRSVFIKLGSHNRRCLIDQDTRVMANRDDYPIPKGSVPFYSHVSVELHGSFFDNSPDFSLEKFIAFCQRLGYVAKAQDIAFCDDLHVTELSDWLRVSRRYSDHYRGNIFLHAKAFPVEPDGEFQQISIGSAASKSAYATLYQRPEYLRLELKLRPSQGVIMKKLDSLWNDKDHSLFEAKARDVLITNCDIVTRASKEIVAKTKDNSKYVREPFYQNFLNSVPVRVSIKELKAAKQDARKKSLADDLTARLKRAAGCLDNVAQQFQGDFTQERITEEFGKLCHSFRLLPGALP